VNRSSSRPASRAKADFPCACQRQTPSFRKPLRPGVLRPAGPAASASVGSAKQAKRTGPSPHRHPQAPSAWRSRARPCRTLACSGSTTRLRSLRRGGKCPAPRQGGPARDPGRRPLAAFFRNPAARSSKVRRASSRQRAMAQGVRRSPLGSIKAATPVEQGRVGTAEVGQVRQS